MIRITIIAVAAWAISTAIVRAEDCRPLPELLVEAMLRGEDLRHVTQDQDGRVWASLRTADWSSRTILFVTEGEDVDQACVVSQMVTVRP